jgi:hypothetical protein
VVTRVGFVSIDLESDLEAPDCPGRWANRVPGMEVTHRESLKVPGRACRPFRLAIDLNVPKQHDFDQMDSRQVHASPFVRIPVISILDNEAPG